MISYMGYAQMHYPHLTQEFSSTCSSTHETPPPRKVKLNVKSHDFSKVFFSYCTQLQHLFSATAPFSFLPGYPGYSVHSLIYYLWHCGSTSHYSFIWYEVTQTTALRLLLVISLLTPDVSICMITQSDFLWKTTTLIPSKEVSHHAHVLIRD